MSQPGQPQWIWNQEHQQYYFYDAHSDVLVFQSGDRIPRPHNVPRTAFTSASSQAAAAPPSSSSYAPHPSHANPNYVTGVPGQQYHPASARPGPHPAQTAGPSRSQSGYQDLAGSSSSQVDALAQNVAAISISTQHPHPGLSRHPQPVTPQVRFGNNGQRIVEAADPTTNLRTIIQTAPVNAITDPVLLQSGIHAKARLIPAENDVTERLFKSFRLRDQPRKFFTVGKVFLVLWVEPAGESITGVTGLEIGTTIGRFGERAFSKVRRFVVVREGDNYCSALPITSYGHRGVGKPGVNKSEHSIIYTTKAPPDPLPGELPTRGENGMRPQAIRVDTDDPAEKLDHHSRLDYGKVHTIQHNIKVKAFGKVNPKSMYALINQFGNLWRPLPATGPAPISEYVEQVDQPTAPAREPMERARRPSQVSARVTSGGGSISALQTRSVAERGPSEADRATVVQADVRLAVQALVQQGHTVEQAERAIRDELARRREAARRRNTQQDDDDDDESSDEDEAGNSGQRADADQQRDQRQQTGSSQARSGSTQQTSTRTPASSQATGAHTAAQSQAQARSTSASTTSQVQPSRAQVEALMARLLQGGKTREEALAIIRARLGRSS